MLKFEKQLLDTAVLFLVFNRPDTTQQVFEQIRRAKPPRLYIAADGPRENVPGEAERVKEVREYVLNNIDWDCEVKTLFRDKNLGCKYAVSSAITWFFEHEEMGIILEDDTVPSLSFFWFCEELLERYKDDLRVWHIGGNNFNFARFNYYYKYSYFFSRFAQVWGWATWRNRWNKYDVDINDWPYVKKYKLLHSLFPKHYMCKLKEQHFEAVFEGKIDTWDYQWQLTVLVNNGLCVVPIINLITNIGFGNNATHTKVKDNRFNLKRDEIVFPLVHPDFILPNNEIDHFMAENMGIKLSVRNFLKVLIG